MPPAGLTPAAARPSKGHLPAASNFPPGEFGIAGRDTTEKLFAHGRMVSGGYFRALRIPILQGETCGTDAGAPLFPALGS